jgi:hypothetical protein
VLDEGKAVPDALGVEDHGVVEVGISGVAGAAAVKQRLAGVEEEWNLDIE